MHKYKLIVQEGEARSGLRIPQTVEYWAHYDRHAIEIAFLFTYSTDNFESKENRVNCTIKGDSLYIFDTDENGNLNSDKETLIAHVLSDETPWVWVSWGDFGDDPVLSKLASKPKVIPLSL